MPTVPEQPPVLTVKLGAPADAVAVGRPVSLNASISGGKPPTATAGRVQSAAARATLTPLWAGDWSVSVEVADADGAWGTGLATVRAAPATVKLEGPDGRVFYSSTAVLNAAGLGRAARAGGGRGPNCPPPYTSPFCVDTSIRITKAGDYAARRPRSRRDLHRGPGQRSFPTSPTSDRRQGDLAVGTRAHLRAAGKQQ